MFIDTYRPKKGTQEGDSRAWGEGCFLPLKHFWVGNSTWNVTCKCGALGGFLGQPRPASLVAQRVNIYLQSRRPKFNPWVKKISWRRKWQPTPVLLPGKFHGWRNLVDNSPCGSKELDTIEQLHFSLSDQLVTRV